MASLNQELQNGILRNQHQIVRFEKTIDAKIQANLLELQREIGITVNDADFGQRSATQQRRIRSTQADVNVLVNDAYAQNARDLQRGLTGMAPQVERLTVKAINNAFTFDITSPTLTPTELRVLSRNPVVLGGKTLERWFGQRQSMKQGFVQEMRLGIAQGETNQQIVNRLIGKPTGQRKTITLKDGSKKSIQLRSGGVMGVSKREATALVRTSTQTVSNRVLFETYKDNADIIAAVEVLVTLDGRTTLICMSLSGGIWSLETGEALPQSAKQIDYPGDPPYHWQALSGDAIITTEQGPKRLDEVEPGDMVMTGKGRFRPCYAVHRKLHKGRILDISFDSGAKLTITDDHPVAIAGRGWQAAGKLEVGDECFQYQKSVETLDNRTPPCGVAEGDPSLFAEELVSDEVRCLPLFRGVAVDLQHDAAREREIDDVPVLAQLKQVAREAECREYSKEISLAAGGVVGEVARPLCSDRGDRLGGRDRIVLTHSLGDTSDPGIGVFGEAVVPGGVIDPRCVGKLGTKFAATRFDAVPSTATRHGVIGQSKVACDRRQRLPAIDVAALDELLQQITIVPGSGFIHDRVTSVTERAWVGTVYNLSVIGDETYVAGAILVHNCRTVVSPVTKSWEELGTRKKGEILDKASSPSGVRSSMTGDRPGDQRYSGFLRDQGTKFQNQVLGRGRARMFRAGDLKLDQLTDASLVPLTLQQLRAL